VGSIFFFSWHSKESKDRESEGGAYGEEKGVPERVEVRLCLSKLDRSIVSTYEIIHIFDRSSKPFFSI
jgi:hypothetical protein